MASGSQLNPFENVMDEVRRLAQLHHVTNARIDDLVETVRQFKDGRVPSSIECAHREEDEENVHIPGKGLLDITCFQPNGPQEIIYATSDELNDVRNQVEMIRDEIMTFQDFQKGMNSPDCENHCIEQQYPAHAESKASPPTNEDIKVACEEPKMEKVSSIHRSLHSMSKILHIDEIHETYFFRNSMWDAIIYVGVPALGHGASLLICMAFLLMLICLVVFSYIIVENFTEPDVFDGPALKKWRIQQAHLLEFSDSQSGGTSLVERVCNNDMSLIYASSQVQIVGDLDAYLPNSAGPVLCVLAVLVWYMTVFREVYELTRFSFAVANLHKWHHHTTLSFDGSCFALDCVSTSRALFASFVVLLRCGTLVVLFYAGTLYIVYTISVEDLLLNCVALALILDMSEIVFKALAPSQIRRIFRGMQQVKLGGWPRIYGADLLNLVAFISLIAGVVLVHRFTLGPYVEDLENVKHILCGGNLDFVVLYDSVSQAWISPSAPFSDDIELYEDQDLSWKGVEEAAYESIESALTQGWLKWGGYGARPSSLYSAAEDYARLSEIGQHTWFREIQRFPALLNAEDPDLHPHDHHHLGLAYEKHSGDRSDDVDPPLALLRFLIRNQTATCDRLYEVDRTNNPFQDAASCYHTGDSNVRKMNQIQALCPYGCGCYSPWIGTIFKGSGGCPHDAVKSHLYQDELHNFPCADPSNHANTTIIAWLRIWKNNSEVQMLNDRYYKYKQLGAIAIPDPASADFCKHIFRILSYRNSMAPAICPIEFGCQDGKIPPQYEHFCPRACVHHHQHPHTMNGSIVNTTHAHHHHARRRRRRQHHHSTTALAQDHTSHLTSTTSTTLAHHHHHSDRRRHHHHTSTTLAQDRRRHHYTSTTLTQHHHTSPHQNYSIHTSTPSQLHYRSTTTTATTTLKDTTILTTTTILKHTPFITTSTIATTTTTLKHTTHPPLHHVSHHHHHRRRRRV